MRILSFVLVIFAMFLSPLAQGQDMSLVDLFGEEAVADKKVSSIAQKQKKEAPKQKDKDDEEGGVFSIFNFSFFKNGKKTTEAVSLRDGDVETFEQKMIRQAQEGDNDAALTLGYMYLYGENNVNQDFKKAIEYYTLGSDRGDIIAMNNLGSLYYSGIGTPRNVLKASKLFEDASKLGNNESAVNLAVIYLNSPDVGIMEDKIIALLTQAANGGNLTAQYLLGYAYYRGFGVEKDFAKSFEMLKISAQEYDEAQYELAQRYLNGEGVARNYGNAVKYLIMSANQGNSEAMMQLADILAEGKIYTQNPYDAYLWYSVSAVSQTPNAAEKRDLLEGAFEIEDLLRAQSMAEGFVAKPSPTSQYISQTFGKNIKSFIDKPMSTRSGY